MRDPLPRTIYGGSEATDLNARTGEFTPPGIRRMARAWSSWLLLRFGIGVFQYISTASSQEPALSIQPQKHFPFGRKLQNSKDPTTRLSGETLEPKATLPYYAALCH